MNSKAPNCLLLAVFPLLRATSQVLDHLLEAQLPATQASLLLADITGKLRRFQALGDEPGRQQPYWQDVHVLTRLPRPLQSQEMPGIGILYTVGQTLPAPRPRDMTALLEAQGVAAKDSSLLAECLRRGDILLLLRVPDEDAARWQSTLLGFQPIDLDKRQQLWEQQGWRGFDPMADPFSAEEWFQRQRLQHPTRSLSQLPNPPPQASSIRHYALDTSTKSPADDSSS